MLANDWRQKLATCLEKAGKEMPVVRDGEKRPEAVCNIFFTSPFEDLEPKDYPQGQWVGNACLINAGVSSALDPWTLKSAVVSPIKICTEGVQHLRSQGNFQNRAIFQGYEIELNCCIPILDPEEDVNLALLSVLFLSKSTEGQKMISRFFTNDDMLFDYAMVNAMYGVAALSTLTHASSKAQYRMGMQTYMTLLASNLNGFYWVRHLNNIIADPIGFIGSKDKNHLPNVTLMILPLCCTQKAMSLPVPQVRKLFYFLLVRHVAELTSEESELKDVILYDEQKYRQAIIDAFKHAGSSKIEFFMPAESGVMP